MKSNPNLLSSISNILIVIALCLQSCTSDFDESRYRLTISDPNNSAQVRNTIDHGLPVLVINTEDSKPIVSKEYYLPHTSISLLTVADSFDIQTQCKISGRGNTTWFYDKKPYKLKFNERQQFFENGSYRKWVLLANAFDGTMLRNDLVFHMAREYGNFSFVPRFQYVDLLLNNTYNGTYQLGEKLEIAKGRVLDGRDGFLLEIDSRCISEADAVYFYAPRLQIPINVKSLKVNGVDSISHSSPEFAYVRDKVCSAVNILYSDTWLDPINGYKSVIDMESFVEWYVVNEISKNNDSYFFTSCYMSLASAPDSKLSMGPLWDYDGSFGNCVINDCANPENFWIRQAGWYPRLFQDPEFVDAVKKRFQQYYDHRSEMLIYIDNISHDIEKSMIADTHLWGRLTSKSASDDAIRSEYYKQVDILRAFLLMRMEWLKAEFDKL